MLITCKSLFDLALLYTIVAFFLTSVKCKICYHLNLELLQVQLTRIESFFFRPMAFSAEASFLEKIKSKQFNLNKQELESISKNIFDL